MKHGTKELWPHVYRVPWIIIHPIVTTLSLVLPCSNIAQPTQSFWLYIKCLRSIVSLDMAVRTSLRIASYKYSVLPGYKLWFHGEFQSSLRARKKQSKMIGKRKKDRSLRFVCITWRVSKGFGEPEFVAILPTCFLGSIRFLTMPRPALKAVGGFLSRVGTWSMFLFWRGGWWRLVVSIVNGWKKSKRFLSTNGSILKDCGIFLFLQVFVL